jgi:hypothetical protein
MYFRELQSLHGISELEVENCLPAGSKIRFSKPGSACCGYPFPRKTSGDSPDFVCQDKPQSQQKPSLPLDVTKVDDYCDSRGYVKLSISDPKKLSRITLLGRNVPLPGYALSEDSGVIVKKRNPIKDLSLQWPDNFDWYTLAYLKKNQGYFDVYSGNVSKVGKINIKDNEISLKIPCPPPSIGKKETTIIARDRDKNIYTYYFFTTLGSLPPVPAASVDPDDTDEDEDIQDCESGYKKCSDGRCIPADQCCTDCTLFDYCSGNAVANHQCVEGICQEYIKEECRADEHCKVQKDFFDNAVGAECASGDRICCVCGYDPCDTENDNKIDFLKQCNVAAEKMGCTELITYEDELIPEGLEEDWKSSGSLCFEKPESPLPKDPATCDYYFYVGEFHGNTGGDEACIQKGFDLCSSGCNNLVADFRDSCNNFKNFEEMEKKLEEMASSLPDGVILTLKGNQCIASSYPGSGIVNCYLKTFLEMESAQCTFEVTCDGVKTTLSACDDLIDGYCPVADVGKSFFCQSGDGSRKSFSCCSEKVRIFPGFKADMGVWKYSCS